MAVPIESRKAFKKRVHAQLESPVLQKALPRALHDLNQKRLSSLNEIDFEHLRHELSLRKTAYQSKYNELFNTFKQKAESQGAFVHFAEDEKVACEIILKIVQSRNAKLVVKSKSMATEEIHLNRYLESAGINVVETDLGERLVQLSGSKPSHLVAPAIHLTKEEAARLISEQSKRKVPAEHEEILAEARRQLRELFLTADIGISGANLAVAETGSIVIVSNEGNVELATTLPPVHIAVFGIDKIVETLDDLPLVLRLLPRSGTGQRITSYVSIISGPSRSADIEQSLAIGVHGPNELHMVVIDNGRTKAVTSPYAPALNCIRCGACADVCPPYMAVGGHVFGHIYTGPIGLVLTGIHHGLENAGNPNTLCAQCGACAEACPAEIPIPELILKMRQEYVEKFGMPLKKRLLLESFEHYRLKAFGYPFASIVGQLFAAGVPMAKLMENSLFTRSARDDPAEKDVPTAYLFPGCLVDMFAHQQGRSFASLLRYSGFRVVYPDVPICCGLVAFNAGDRAKSERMIKATIDEILSKPAQIVVSPSTSCTAFLVNDAKKVLAQDSEYLDKLEQILSRLIIGTNFLDELSCRLEGKLPEDLKSVAYHDSCQSLRDLKIYDQPRQILSRLNCEYEVIQGPAYCCGFGGSFSFDYPDVAAKLADWKIDAILESGKKVIVSDNPGCLIHLQARVQQRGLKLKVMHLAEVVDTFIRFGGVDHGTNTLNR